MASTVRGSDGNGEVLFFIPDIGGFTRFVAETEIRHSQHIVKELLEILVDANALGLEVSEIEGDAVLFVREGPPPTLDALVDQARRMFVAFHAHLQRIERFRVCQCGACVGASRISLKIVAHAGLSSTMQIKGHRKFIGTDIIIAHRLLKNSVPVAEYLLVTQSTLARLPAAADDPLRSFGDGSSAYAELGDIAYRYKALAGYLGEVVIEPPLRMGLKNPVQVMTLSQPVAVPVEQVFQRLIDLPARMQWIDGIRSIEFRDDSANHIGKVHRCVRDGSDPELVTSDVKVAPQSMELWETDVRRMASCRYLLTRMPGDVTRVTVEFFVRGNLLLRLAFKAFAERRFKASFERSLRNLAAVCEGREV